MTRCGSLHYIFLAVPFLPLSAFVNATLDTGLNTSIPPWLFNGTIPEGSANLLPKACIRAYSAAVNCNAAILMSPNVDGKAATLNETCEQECADDLLTYERKVRVACGSVDLEALGLDGTWLDFVVKGEAGVILYWKNCLRSLKSSRICSISQGDYESAWSAAIAESPDSPAVKKFCQNTCLTQTIVLNVPTQENLNDLKSMCQGTVQIQEYPFVDAMRFAGLIALTPTDAAGENSTAGSRKEKEPVAVIPTEASSGAGSERVGLFGSVGLGLGCGGALALALAVGW